MNKRNRTQKSVSIIINVLITLALCIVFYVFWKGYYAEITPFYRKGNWLVLFVYMFLLGLLSHLYGAYKFGVAKTLDIVYSFSFSLLFTNLLMYLQTSLIVLEFVDISVFFLCFICQILFSYLFITGSYMLFYKYFPAKETIIIYCGEYTNIYEKLIKYQNLNFNIIKVININDSLAESVINLQKYESIIMINLSTEQKEKIVNYCYSKTISLYDFPNFYGIVMNSGKKIHLIDTPLLELNNFGPSQIDKIIKRGIDLIVSMIALLCMWPVMLIVAICIKLYDGGPIFYKQKRLTQHGKVFEIYKFRSMIVDAEKGKAQFAKKNDDRITKIGKFIRATRLDELPQLVNIFLGDMSLVGPRPERPEIAEETYKGFPEFKYRLKVKAGLTGYAQIYGKYNTDLKDKLLLDIMYIENYSILLDIKLMLLTIKILFMKESTEGV